jgi:hypothetical protein
MYISWGFVRVRAVDSTKNLIRPPIIKSKKRTTQLQGKKCSTKTVKLLWVA